VFKFEFPKFKGLPRGGISHLCVETYDVASPCPSIHPPRSVVAASSRLLHPKRCRLSTKIENLECFFFFLLFCQPTHLSHNTIPSLQTFRHLFLAFLSLSLSKMLTSMLSKNGAAAMRAAAAARRAPPHAFTASRGFAKDIKFGVDGRAAMLRGVDILADAVQVSLVYSFLGVLMDQQGSLSCSSS
jgi:hypothetical protein